MAPDMPLPLPTLVLAPMRPLLVRTMTGGSDG
jgi:hypothetical protein